MAKDYEQSLGAERTSFGRQPRNAQDELSLSDERTLGDGRCGQDTVIDDIEVVDLEARYKVESTLGQGGMGAVILATDTRLDRKVAIKRILGEAAGNRMAVQRFLTEAKAIAALNHPNIVQIYDYGRAKDGPFLIMEYVDGGSLLDRCRESAVPLDQAIELACQLCDGLAKAHDLGIVHRDIKPANVLLTKDGIPKLTDFGLAKAQAGDHGQTMTGAVLGTPDFMPPEQRRDASLVDHRSDLWSLAATVYQMVTGRSPKVIRFDLLPAALTTVLGRALEESKEARYSSARELRDALRTALGRRPESFVPAVAEGQCPSCGVQNDTKRKFCRGCAKALEAPCLECGEQMPMWEEICGACGAKQTPLVQERMQAMAAGQADAERLLADFHFDRAMTAATVLRRDPHPRVPESSDWVELFLEQVKESRSQQIARAITALDQAAKHESAHDYTSAIATLQTVPESLRSTRFPNARETVTHALTRLRNTEAEVRRLVALIRERIEAKSLDGLLPEVDKLLALVPHRKDAHKLRKQLCERQDNYRVARIAEAHTLRAQHEYAKAADALAAIPPMAVTTEVAHLREQLEDLAYDVACLKDNIHDAVARNHLDGLLNKVDRYLLLKPEDQVVSTLRQKLLERESQLAIDIEAHVTRAADLKKNARFGDAVVALSKIPANRRTQDMNINLRACTDLRDKRIKAFKEFADTQSDALNQSLDNARQYQADISSARIIDLEFERNLAAAEKQVAANRVSQINSNYVHAKRNDSVKYWLGTLGGVAVWIIGASLWRTIIEVIRLMIDR